jgi:predicted nucleotidyltransferase
VGYLGKAVLLFAGLNFRKAKRYAANAFDNWLLLPVGFKRFFNTKNINFVKRYLGVGRQTVFISVPDVFRNIQIPVSDMDVFVKMDIEGCEYETMPDFKPYHHLINGFGIEFHNLTKNAMSFTEIIGSLSTDFYVAHVHANNGAGYIHGTSLPDLLEITFINKKLMSGTPAYSSKKYPIEGLDFPCVSWMPEMSVNF